MATLRKRSGKYFIDYRINGKRFRKTIGASRKAAGKALKEIEIKIAKGQIGLDHEDEKLQSLFDDFLSYPEISYLPHTTKTETALHERMRLLTIFEKMQEGMLILDRSGGFLYANEAMAGMLRYPREELMKKTLRDLSPADMGKNARDIGDLYEKAMEEKTPAVGEAVCARGDGIHVALMVSVSIFDFKGEKAAYLICRDMTGMKTIMEDLSAKETFFRNIVEQQEELICRWKPGYLLSYVNDAYCKFFGKKREELLGRSFLDFVPKELHDEIERYFSAINRNNPIATHLHRVTGADGKEKWVEWTNKAMFGADGKVSEYQDVGRDITGIKDMQDALKKRTHTERLYRRLVEFRGDAIYRYTFGEGRIIFANRGFVDLLELDCAPDEVVGKYLKDLIKYETEEGLVRRAISENEGIRDFEYHFKTLKGNTKWVLHDSVIIDDPESGSQIVEAIVKDITPRKKALRALEESREKYRELFNNSEIGIFRTTIDTGEVLEYNDTFRTMMNVSPEIELTTILAPDHYAHRSDRKKFVDKLKKEGSVANYKMLLRKEDGSPAWVSVSARIYPEKGYIEGAMIDITKEKTAEKEAAFHRDRSKLYLDTVGVMVVAIGLDRKVAMINKKGCEMLGYTKDEIIGKDWFENFIPEGSREEVRSIFTRLIEGDVVPAENVENAVLTKSGEERIILWHNVIVRDENGKVKYTLGSGDDITERRNMEDELNRSYQDLITLNSKLRELALVDPHTKLYNHRYLEEIIETEFSRCKRYGYPLSLIMLDIDYFRSINDVYGHHFGDMIIKQFADCLKRKFRKYDVVGRFGGEEFIVVSSGTDAVPVTALARRILDEINREKFGDGERKIKLKLSIGIASYPNDPAVKGMDLVGISERNLNRAKKDGGNRVYDSTGISELSDAIAEEKESIVLVNELNKLTKRANQSLVESIFAFAKTIEMKDNYTGEHVEETVKYAIDIARAMDLPLEDIERIRQASMLHDLGKIGISESILNKPGALTKEEFEQIKKHPQIAADILRPIQFLHDIIPLILYHHEKWDGTGYPSGLKGEEIPLGARIISLADVYQALISDRPYRRAYPRDKVMDIINEESGTHFDPSIVKVFLEIANVESR